MRTTFIEQCTPIIESLTTSTSLAPSPRVLAFLASRGRIPSYAMAIVPVEHTFDLGTKKEKIEEPPEVAITPCDAWPRPYYLKNGLRKVAPYHFTYNTYCKERWRGREVLDIFASEFRDRPLEYYVSSHPQQNRRCSSSPNAA